MATETSAEGDAACEAPWTSVSPSGLWQVRRRWTAERELGDDTPLMGSVCKIRVSLKSHTEPSTRPQSPNSTELPVSSDSGVRVTQHSRSQDSVLQVPLDGWVLLRMGEGQCDVVESCLEGMKAGESCEFTIRPRPECPNAVTRSEETEADEQCQRFSLHLHSFTPGQESWQMPPAEKWAWVQSHKQRGSQRFGKGDIWGAAQSYCCAVKLLITLKGHTRGELGERKDQDRGADDEEDDGEEEAKSSPPPDEEQCRTMKAELHSNLSLCQLRLGQPAKARDSSAKAVALDPVSVKAWYRLGQACLQLGDLGEARQAFSRVLELQPDSASARAALKRVDAKAKEMDAKLGQRLSKMFSSQ